MKKAFLIPVFLIFLFPVENNSSAETTSLFTRLDYSTDSITSKLAVGNFNNDDFIDIITVSNTGIISVFSGNGEGSFSDAETFSADTGEPDYLIVNDFNLDSISDVVINDKLMLGDGSGSFHEGTTLETQGLYPSLSGDVIMDGRPDLLVVRGYVVDDHNKFELQVFPGNGDGTFGEPVLNDLPGAIGCGLEHIGDFNNDGNTDLILFRWVGWDEFGPLYKSSKIEAPFYWYSHNVLLGNGDGTFAEWSQNDSENAEFEDIYNIKDFNGDGVLDLFGTSVSSGFLWTLKFGNGQGNFNDTKLIESHVYLTGSSKPSKPFIFDLNKDTFLDICLIKNYSEFIYFLGNGDGTFKEPVILYIYVPNEQDVIVADFNNDLYDDFVISVKDSSLITVMINQGNFIDPTIIDSEKENKPVSFYLGKNYPNPFNPSTTISFSIPEQGYITLSVYDITGQKVATLVDSPMSAGSHSVIFNGSDLGSGVYLYKLESKGFNKTGKMLLVK